MSHRVQKEIGRLYRCIISLSAICFCRVKDTVILKDGKIFDFSPGCGREDGGNNRRPSSQGASFSAITFLKNALDSLPNAASAAQPPLTPLTGDIFACELEFIHTEKHRHNNHNNKEKSAEDASRLPNMRRLFGRFRKPGLDNPHRTINLARDDLASQPAVL